MFFFFFTILKLGIYSQYDMKNAPTKWKPGLVLDPLLWDARDDQNLGCNPGQTWVVDKDNRDIVGIWWGYNGTCMKQQYRVCMYIYIYIITYVSCGYGWRIETRKSADPVAAASTLQVAAPRRGAAFASKTLSNRDLAAAVYGWNSCTSLAFMGVPQRSFLSLNLICCLSYQRLKLDWMESRFWTNRHLVDWRGNVQDHLDVLELQQTFANLAYSKSLDWLLHLSRWFLFRKAWADEDSHNTDRCTCNRWLTPTDGTLLIIII